MNMLQEHRKGQDPRTLENTKPTEIGSADGYPHGVLPKATKIIMRNY